MRQKDIFIGFDSMLNVKQYTDILYRFTKTGHLKRIPASTLENVGLI